MIEEKYKKAEEIKRKIRKIEDARKELQNYLERDYKFSLSISLFIPNDEILVERIKDVFLIRKAELQDEFNNL